jgi:dolichol kinase
MASTRFYMSYEFRRKLTHFLIGLGFVCLFNIRYFYDNAGIIILFLLIASMLLSITCKYLKPKTILLMLQLFDKPKDFERFPGKGAVYYLSGILVSVLFFDRSIASACIIILAVGDPAAHFFGRYFGKTRLIINERKLLEGTLAGVFFGTIAASFFVPFPLAFFGAAFGMIAEAVELELFNLDDNFFIPLVAGLVMTTISAAL